MSFGEVVNCLLIISIALANGMPQDKVAAPQEKTGSPPLIEFTNGGIRVNFAGYHAEAGLGGLFRGTGPGLHVSAGTPWGPSAAAGLGGQLNGVEGSTGGGLYARAGLGHGRPEAAAGLGGRLDGSGRSLNPISGGLYAGATTGGVGPGTGVYLGGGLAAKEFAGPGGVIVDEFIENRRAADAIPTQAPAALPGVNSATNETKPTRGYTNIQIIPSKPKDGQKEKEKLALEATALPADAPLGGSRKIQPQDKETRRAAPDSIIPPAVEVAPVVSIIKSFEKGVVPVPVSPVPVSQDNNQYAIKPIYPRWYFRKRFRTVPRKIFYTPAVSPTVIDSQNSPSTVVDRLFAANAVSDGGVIAVDKTYKGGSFFDDIFNIPISTLSAVNQLLNNVG